MELFLNEITVSGFLNALGSDAPAPGGGAASGLSGSLAAALGKMVADLTLKRKKYEDFWDLAKNASDILAVKIETFRILAEEDARAYTNYSKALALPKETEEEKATRKNALNEAILFSTDVPCRVISTALETLPVLENLYGKSNKTCMGDLAAAAEELNTACKIAWLNVLANVPYLPDAEVANKIMTEKKLLLDEVSKRCSALYDAVEKDIIKALN